MPIYFELKSLGILTTATIRVKRTGGCPLKCEKDLKKRFAQVPHIDLMIILVLFQYDGLIISQFNECVLAVLLSLLAQ